MTNLEIEKLLHEKVMGLEWKEPKTEEFHCKTCGIHKFIDYENPSYTSSRWWLVKNLLNPLKGSTALAEFVEANQQCFKGE